MATSNRPVKGVRDFYPDDLRVRNWLFDHWRAVAGAFGYEEYDACVLEHEELYVRKAGDEITDQLYNFTDKGGRRVSLRPELTPSLVRMLHARGGTVPLPARWFSIPQCFRYERMQRGRKREHYQWNLDIVGLASEAAEVELMAAQLELLRRVGLADDVEFRVSNRQVLEHHLADLGITSDRFATICVIVDKAAKIGEEACREQLGEAGLDGAQIGHVLTFLEARGLDALRPLVGADNPGLTALQRLLELAAAAGIAETIMIDCSVVRGLSYYTGTVWELFDTAGALPRAIAGGGRYDRLSEHLGGPPLPMVGFGFGDVVLLELLAARKLLPELPVGIDDVVYPMAEAGYADATRLAMRLRAAGRRVRVDYSCRRFKHVIKAAEDLRAARLLTLGEHERAAGIVKVRHLTDHTETDVPLDAVEPPPPPPFDQSPQSTD